MMTNSPKGLTPKEIISPAMTFNMITILNFTLSMLLYMIEINILTTESTQTFLKHILKKVKHSVHEKKIIAQSFYI